MSSSLLRPLREEDAAEVAALFVECFGAARSIDAEEIRTWLANAEFEPDWLRVLERHGRVVGYGDIWPQADDLWLDVAAQGHEEVFFDWAEGEARARGIGRVRVQIPHGHELASFAEACGYARWRHSFTMEIDLTEPPVRSQPPPGIELRSYREDDTEALLVGLNTAFAEDPFWHEVTPRNFREFYLGARGFDPSLWLLAWDGAALAGFVLNYPEHGSDLDLGFVNTLGVCPPWRRRGLGESLLRTSFAELYARGRRRVGLGVDAQNVTGAVRLYERVGMRQIRRSDNWQKDV